MRTMITPSGSPAGACRWIRIVCLASLFGGCAGALAMNRAEPPLVAEPAVAIPGATGRFDFIEVDAQLDRLLASHTANGTLDVFDLANGALIKKVPVGAAQAVAIDPVRDRYYVTCSREQCLAVVDRKTLAKTGEIKLGGPADLIALDTKRGRLYVGHDDASEVWVVDTKSEKVVATVALPSGDGPEGVVYDPGADRIYQSVKTDDSIVVIDPESNTVKARWLTTPATKPHGLAMDGERHWLFSAGANGKLAVIDARTGKSVATVEIASGVDQIAFDPARHRLYCGSSTGVVSVVEETDAGARFVGDIKTAAGAKSMAVDPKRHAAWTCYGNNQASYLIRLSAP